MQILYGLNLLGGTVTIIWWINSSHLQVPDPISQMLRRCYFLIPLPPLPSCQYVCNKHELLRVLCKYSLLLYSTSSLCGGGHTYPIPHCSHAVHTWYAHALYTLFAAQQGQQLNLWLRASWRIMMMLTLELTSNYVEMDQIGCHLLFPTLTVQVSRLGQGFKTYRLCDAYRHGPMPHW